MPTNIKWLDIASASKLTGYHPQTLRQMCRDMHEAGEPGVFKMPGRNAKWKIKPDIVWPDMYMEGSE